HRTRQKGKRRDDRHQQQATRRQDKQPGRRGLRDGNHAFDRNPVRSRVAAALHRQLDDLLDCVRRDPAGTVGPRGSAKRASITELAVRVQATRALVTAAVQASSTDVGAMFDAAMAGVMGGDLSEDFGEAALAILGPAAALSGAAENGIPGGGAFEYGLRQSIMYVVGGGTNDVQRGLIARGLGLPR